MKPNILKHYYCNRACKK